jgi:hypothetical protein
LLANGSMSVAKTFEPLVLNVKSSGCQTTCQDLGMSSRCRGM